MTFTAILPTASWWFLQSRDLSPVREFKHHDTFVAYLDGWSSRGYAITWLDAVTAQVGQ